MFIDHGCAVLRRRGSSSSICRPTRAPAAIPKQRFSAGLVCNLPVSIRDHDCILERHRAKAVDKRRVRDHPGDSLSRAPTNVGSAGKIGVHVIIIIRVTAFPLIAGHPRNNTVALVRRSSRACVSEQLGRLR